MTKNDSNFYDESLLKTIVKCHYVIIWMSLFQLIIFSNKIKLFREYHVDFQRMKLNFIWYFPFQNKFAIWNNWKFIEKDVWENR